MIRREVLPETDLLAIAIEEVLAPKRATLP